MYRIYYKFCAFFTNFYQFVPYPTTPLLSKSDPYPTTPKTDPPPLTGEELTPLLWCGCSAARPCVITTLEVNLNYYTPHAYCT